MKTLSRFTIALALLLSLAGFAKIDQPVDPERDAPDVSNVRFEILEVYVDSGVAPLAAYQLEIRAVRGQVRIVGIEGGEHPAFREAPYYDPAAMQAERVIIADFSTSPAASLPTGRTRIATIHLHITGDAEPLFDATLDTAATLDGEPIDIDITTRLGRDS
jgi:hypothetical protein